MATSREERNRILGMVAAGQVSVDEAAQLFDVLFTEPAAPPAAPNRTMRLWVTDTATHRRKVNMTATLPVGILRTSVQILANLMPPLRDGRAEQIIRALESGSTGRIMDVQDLEDGKRVEIFIEQ